LLYFGTRAFVGANCDSDYDFMLILDKYNPTDIFKLRKVCQSTQFKDLDLNVNFLYLSDIKARGFRNFQLRSLRIDFYKYLDFKIQEHYGRCDKMFLQNLKDEILYKNIKKYIKGIIRFILIREDVMTFSDITKYSFNDIFDLAADSKIFTPSTSAKFTSLSKDYSGKKSLEVLDSVRRSVYETYLNLYSNNS